MNELEKEMPYYPAGIESGTELFVVFSDEPEIKSLDASELLFGLSEFCDLREYPFGAFGEVGNQLDHYIAAEWVARGVSVHYYTTLERARALHPTLPLSESLQESLDYP